MDTVIPRLPAVAQAGARAAMAMGYAGLNRPDQARQECQAGETILRAHWFSDKRVALSGDPNDWLIAKILLEEARNLVGPSE